MNMLRIRCPYEVPWGVPSIDAGLSASQHVSQDAPALVRPWQCHQ